jgi:hypothetical protein
VVAPRGERDDGADPAGGRARDEERPHLLLVSDRDGRRDERGRAQVGEQRPDDVERTEDVHGEERRPAVALLPAT